MAKADVNINVEFSTNLIKASDVTRDDIGRMVLRLPSCKWEKLTGILITNKGYQFEFDGEVFEDPIGAEDKLIFDNGAYLGTLNDNEKKLLRDAISIFKTTWHNMPPEYDKMFDEIYRKLRLWP